MGLLAWSEREKNEDTRGFPPPRGRAVNHAVLVPSSPVLGLTVWASVDSATCPP